MEQDKIKAMSEEALSKDSTSNQLGPRVETKVASSAKTIISLPKAWSERYLLQRPTAQNASSFQVHTMQNRPSVVQYSGKPSAAGNVLTKRPSKEIEDESEPDSAVGMSEQVSKNVVQQPNSLSWILSKLGRMKQVLSNLRKRNYVIIVFDLVVGILVLTKAVTNDFPPKEWTYIMVVGLYFLLLLILYLCATFVFATLKPLKPSSLAHKPVT